MRHCLRTHGAIVIAGMCAIAVPVVRGRYLRWGATPDEIGMALAGDQLVPEADMISTRGITIAARPADIWPWVAQLGQGRGGFYTYDLLENIVGCQMHSADRVVPEWQSVEVGDALRLHPEVSLQVVAVERGRSLVLRGGVPMGRMPPPYDFTWAFVLREQQGGSTRLIVRERYAYTRAWSPLLVEPVQLVSFVMSRGMLRGIRRRVLNANR